MKPCPFCGGEPKLIDCPESFNEGAVVVECQDCHASGPVVFAVKDDPKPHALYSWNRRDEREIAKLRQDLLIAQRIVGKQTNWLEAIRQKLEDAMRIYPKI